MESQVGPVEVARAFEGKMISVDTNKEQLIKEIENLRWRVGELEKLQADLERDNEALRESEEKLKAVLDNIDDVVFQLSPLGIIRYVSPKVEEIYGYKPKDLIGKHLKKTTPVSELPKALNALKSVLSGKAIANLEIDQLDAAGEIVPMDINVAPVRKDGSIIAVQGVMRDITKRKQAEETLRKSQASLAEAQRIAHVGNWDWDIVKNELVWSDEIYRIFGLNPQEFGVTYEVFLNYVHPDDREFVQKCVDGVLYEKKPYSLDHRIVRPDGSERIVHEQGEVTFDETSKPIRMIGTVHDITEHKRAQEAEEAVKHSTQKIVKAMEDTIQAMARIVEMRDPYTAGHQRRVTQLACAIAKEIELPQDQISGLRLAGLIHDIGKVRVPSEILTNPDGLSEAEFTMIKMHPVVGYEILKTIDLPWPIAEVVYQHHERMNGSGYPSGLTGADIILEARILAVADVVEAIASHRPYRPALGTDAALNEISQKKGILYDPKVVDACLTLFRKQGFGFE